MKKNAFFTALLCAGTIAAFGAAPVFQTPKMQKAPLLDGKDSSAWKDATTLYGFYERVSGNLEPRSGRTLVGYDASHFYLRVETELPPEGTELLSSIRKHDGKVYTDDSIEIWLAPEKQNFYYQYIVNFFGTVYDIRHDRTGGIPDESWTANWKKASWLDPVRKVWVFEAAIPLKDLGITGSPDGKEVSMLISRNWKRPWVQSPFIQNEAPFNDLSRYARFILNPEAPSIQIDSIGPLDKQLFELKGSIRNNAKASQTYDLTLHFTHSDMPETNDRQQLTAAPGETKTFSFHDDGGHIHLRASHKADFSIAAGGKTLYAVPFAYKLPIELADAWKVVGKINTNFQFSIYPGLKRAGIRFDAEKNATHATVEIALNGKSVFEKNLAPLKAENLFYFDLPPLADGKYVMTLSTWEKNRKLRSATQEFVRKVFPWENNRLGISDKVYSPFKELQVRGSRLKTVLNEYAFDGTGLYSEVNPAGEPLLKGKVSYHFAANGKPGEFTRTSGAFSKISGAESIFDGLAQTADGFSVKTVSKTEYDGCTRFEMTLAPEAGKNPVIDRFYMDIPLDSKQIRLFHIIKSGCIRTNPVIKVPAGQGVVWKSSDVPNGDFFGNMHIYLWLGEMDRGLSWFADNDKNFSLDDKQPVQELIRNGDTLTLRVYFVNKSFTLSAPRTIVFGMQASPVKPMPKDWRNPKLIIPPHGGSNAYWGIRPAYAGKYPVGYDWEYVDEMVKARESGKIDKNYIDGFLKKHYETLPEAARNSYRSHAYGGHGGMMANRGMQPTMLYLEEHCQDQTTPEWETFQDEWGLVPFTPRKWLKEEELTTGSLRSSVGIGITPVKSYQDFVMWQAREWLKRGIGLYCDNTFPRNSTDTANSSAYLRPDGSVQPSSDIWDMREYHKRMWVLTREMQESVKWPLMVSLHITNGMILPIVCWTDIQLDLEWGWASGYKPFPVELLEIETTGRQIGAYPQAHFPIAGCGLVHENPTYLTGKINEDMVRTDWAMRMIYGVLRYDMRGENFTPLNKIVNDFGLGTDACKVYDYWQKDYPLSVTPDTVKSILLRNGDKAILILASWSETPVKVSVSGHNGLTIRSAAGKFPVGNYTVSGNKFEAELAKYGMQLIHMEVK